jgi:hypothetical protein
LLNRFIGWSLVSFYIWVILSVFPKKKGSDGSKATMQPPNPSDWVRLNRRAKEAANPCLYLLMTCYVCYRLMDWIGRRWPAVTKAFLVDKPGWEQGKESAEHLSSDPMHNEQDAKNTDGPVHRGAFLSMFFFLTNLGICLGWYATVYDPTGTVNPAWTDVFGR